MVRVLMMGWIILGAWTASAGTSKPGGSPAPGTVMVVLSEQQILKLQGGKSYPTGTYLNEFAVPLMALMDAGFEPEFYTPTGKAPVLDVDSKKLSYFDDDEKIFRRALDLFYSIGRSRPLKSLGRFSDVDKKALVAIFVPGGHAPMIDLSRDSHLGSVLHWAHEQKLPTALICHGPIAILSAWVDPAKLMLSLEKGRVNEVKDPTGRWPYQGYSMTVFSNIEEKIAERSKLKGRMPFYPADALLLAGGKTVFAKSWSSHVVEDRELITAQNPNSVKEFSEKLVAAARRFQSLTH